MKTLETKRLILRDLHVSDAQALAEINQDPRILEFLPGPKSYDETSAFIKKQQEKYASSEIGIYGCIEKETDEFIGFVGLNEPKFEANFTPCIEILWRMSFSRWGRGYATEAAKAIILHAFGNLKLSEIVAFTVEENRASRRVMEKLGMTYAPDENFLHPSLPKDHPLAAHVLYRVQNARASLREIIEDPNLQQI